MTLALTEEHLALAESVLAGAVPDRIKLLAQGVLRSM